MLAAGGSARMGHPKQLILHDGKPLVTHAAETALAAGAAPVIVVLGAHAEDIRPALSHLAGVTVVINSDWESGLASSLTTGLRAALRDTTWEGALAMLADQPLVDGPMLRRIIAEFAAGARIVATGYEGVPGVPALFGREHVPELLSLTGDTGAGPWLRSRAREVAIVPLAGAVLDVDTPADVQRLADRRGSR
ncbi:MAG: nucleotidyltransferase family protein [Gemmatimonadaceae bacterium]|nr:nucleotidyltransferase family protein [Gemmatimonadaceae bacterium]